MARAFEASWSPAGAVCFAHLRWEGKPEEQPHCPNMGPAKDGVQCVTSSPKPILTTRSLGHKCDGATAVDISVNRDGSDVQEQEQEDQVRLP
jgi:hypothetical protein